MSETYYFCLDAQAYQYAERHLANKYTKIVACHTIKGVDWAIRAMNDTKGALFYILHCTDGSYMKSEIDKMELLASTKKRVFARLGLN